MMWFNRYSVCSECGVHFEPVNGDGRLFPDLCQAHREPALELHHRKQAVKEWAAVNWEKLEEQMKAVQASERAKWQESNQDLIRSLAANQGAMMNSYAGTNYAAAQQSMGAGMFGGGSQVWRKP